MKSLLAIFTVFTVVLAYVSATALPDIYDGPTYELNVIDEPTLDEATPSDMAPLRQRRFTCDVLSWQSKWFSVRHSACAIKCIAQHRRGGRCRDGICICRK